MQKISALIHANNDAARLARAIESLRLCDEILVVDHGSSDSTDSVAKKHGARVKAAILGVQDGAYVTDLANDWVLCIQPSESASEDLEASLLEWKQRDPDESIIGFRVRVREQNEHGWHLLGQEVRLVNRKRINWTDTLPPNIPGAKPLRGDLLRFKN